MINVKFSLINIQNCHTHSECTFPNSTSLDHATVAHSIVTCVGPDLYIFFVHVQSKINPVDTLSPYISNINSQNLTPVLVTCVTGNNLRYELLKY